MDKNRASYKSPFKSLLNSSFPSILRFCFCALLCLNGLHPKTSWARNMEGRLGIGYNSEFANSNANGFRVPGVSAKYGLTRDVALEGILGFATTAPLNSVTAAKIFRNLFFENNLNFYFMGGLGIINSNSIAGVEFLAGVGAEFFIPGLESLGFSMETGVTFDNGSGAYAIRTLGVSFLDAGIHFYF